MFRGSGSVICLDWGPNPLPKFNFILRFPNLHHKDLILHPSCIKFDIKAQDPSFSKKISFKILTLDPLPFSSTFFKTSCFSFERSEKGDTKNLKKKRRSERKIGEIRKKRNRRAEGKNLIISLPLVEQQKVPSVRSVILPTKGGYRTTR